jgi:hypothetical protein
MQRSYARTAEKEMNKRKKLPVVFFTESGELEDRSPDFEILETSIR